MDEMRKQDIADRAGLASEVSLCTRHCGKHQHYGDQSGVFTWRKWVISGRLVGQAVGLNLLSLQSGPGFTALFALRKIYA